MSADDYDADLAERYGWINRALPADRARRLRQRRSLIASPGFPAAGHAVVKDRVNAIALAPADEFRRDSDLFLEGVQTPEAQARIGGAIENGFQDRDAEMALGRMLADLP